MWHLGRGVTPKEAHAESARVGDRSQSLIAYSFTLGWGDFSKMPILAEKAVGSTTGVKDCQVVITWMVAPFANPIGDAVSGQRIPIPMQ